MGVPKSPRLGVLQLCETITSDADLRSGRGLNQSCSSRRDLSNDMSHATYTQGNQVNSRLFVVRSKIASLTPGLSFGHNLCCRCPNGSCEPTLDIYTWIAFQWYKERPNERFFDLCNRTLSFWESQKTLCPRFGSVSLILTLSQSRVVTECMGDLWHQNAQS
jgi:hypothetical protein